MKDKLLAIDVGTQSTRALIFDLEGDLLFKTQIPLPTYSAANHGWAEIDPEKFWESLCEACQKLWLVEGVDKEQIAGVAVTCQRNVLINLDKEGKPLRPAIHWSDQRRTSGLPKVGGLWGLGFALTGMTGTVRYLQAEAKANWIRTNQPDIWGKTYKLVLLSGYLTYRLTDKFIDSTGNQATHLPFDYKKQKWAGKSDWKWDAIPVERDKLIDLVQPTDLLGEITPRAAEETGIPQGLPLIAAAGDKACEVLGSGGIGPNICCLSYGTAASINTTYKKYVEVIPLIPPYPSAIPGSYSLETQLFRGYWMVTWFLREFGQNEQRLAKERGIKAEQLFDNLIQSVPAGSLGLTVQPYWAPGLKTPGPDAKGAIIGFGSVHTRAHIYRAILEGLAYALREGAERTSERTNVPITEVRVAGGGSTSEAAMQLTADIFGMTVSRPHIYEASGLGAAIDLAVGLGLHPSFEVAVSKMTRVKDSFHPEPENHKIYDDLYHRVYLKMYGRLSPLYTEIQAITGYPPLD